MIYEIIAIIDGAIWIRRLSDDDYGLDELAVAVEYDVQLFQASGESFPLSLCGLAQDVYDWHHLNQPVKII